MIIHASEENRHSLQAQLLPECCSMRNLYRNQPAAGSSSISEKYQGAENAFSAVRLLQSRDQQNLTCVRNCRVHSGRLRFPVWYTPNSRSPYFLSLLFCSP